MTEPLRRASGSVDLSVAAHLAGTRLVDLGQSGCLRLRFPRTERGIEAVAVNLSGGIVAGDRLASSFACGADATLTVTSQAAERCYGARDGDPAAIVTALIDVGAGGRAEWLPQETILFDRARLSRRLDVTMTSSSTVLLVESLVFGRPGHGETLRSVSLRDRIRLVRDGRLVHDSPLRWEGAIDEALGRPALGAGAASTTTILLASAHAAEALEAVRATLSSVPQVRGAASSWNGLLVCRLLGSDWRHRRLVAGVLQSLRSGASLPRVWQV